MKEAYASKVLVFEGVDEGSSISGLWRRRESEGIMLINRDISSFSLNRKNYEYIILSICSSFNMRKLPSVLQNGAKFRLKFCLRSFPNFGFVNKGARELQIKFQYKRKYIHYNKFSIIIIINNLLILNILLI